MNTVPNFAIEIHAKALAARFKSKAEEEAKLHAEMLKKAGDKEGYEVWMMVAKQIKQIKKAANKESKVVKLKKKDKKP